MKNNRRDFLKLSGISGLGVAGSALFPGASFGADESQGYEQIKNLANKKHKQVFNMSGYAAPKIETVRIGVVGLGSRGSAAVRRLSKIDGVDIKALCDLRPQQAEQAKEKLSETSHNPELYSGDAEIWQKLVERKDLDLIYITTPWELHTPIALYAMETDKHAAVEVPAAITMEECWALVETSERTRKHCMMLENTCYDFFELMTLNMVRQGFFGDIVHCEGAYIHDFIPSIFSKKKWNMWRYRHNASRNGNLYPTHGLGPICQAMNINRGDRLDFLVSVSSKDFVLGEMTAKLAEEDDTYKEFVGKPFRGNMNVTTIKTKKGSTIMLQHDVSSPRVYSRIHLVSGTKGVAMKYPLPGRIATSHEGWLSEEEMKVLEEKYQPEIVKRIGEMAKEVGGHGGMDFLMDWRLIDCLRNGLPLEQDVYDAAVWSSIFPLSEWSVANRSSAIDVPDFTGGSWQNNTPVDINLTHGGNTGINL
ncbi:Gfo/Idh/MocA family oxidoreductase [Cyclobacterium marinum]|uniref:Gfo/Idh/MocA family oxidoreductase n=1 Tax=Cyclobacterium marinum TaxID=104 RepID=UPI0011ED4E0E|nr:Gfo/Idh/MocA family oxidoreductase [Cyclobacterium marinum]MBI0400050.1 Gfo/Idh/MocA family oxidoreductase [Cyclobacterium marinum]